MIQRMFQHRSGRVIAVSRALLAILFSLAIWIEPTVGRFPDRAAPLLLIVFALTSLAIIALTWNNWWLEARLAAPAHVFDLVVFTVLIGLTAGYASPFFGIYIFLVLSAAMRWGWRAAIGTILLILLLFFAAGMVAAHSHGVLGFEAERFVIRGTNLLVVSLMIIWFGINQFGQRVGARADPVFLGLAETSEPPVRRSLERIAAALGAGRLVFAWSEAEEPWLNVATLSRGVFEEERLGPEAFPALIASDLADRPFLFDARRQRMLSVEDGRRVLQRRDAVDANFAARFAVAEGVVLPVRAADYEGHVIALAIPGLCSDDLAIAAALGEEVSASFERTALFAANQEAAASRARLHLARDLHDGVVQFQAGMALKLKGIRLAAEQGAPVADELESLQQQLAQEQRDLRMVIGVLRQRADAGDGVDLGQRMASLCRRLERQWGVQCESATEPAAIAVRAGLQHDLDQLIREAVANAVRHGVARHIAVRASLADDRLRLDVEDDGKGFPVHGDYDDADLTARGIGPRSLRERVHALGGTLMLATGATGSRLAIALPFKGAMP